MKIKVCEIMEEGTDEIIEILYYKEHVLVKTILDSVIERRGKKGNYDIKIDEETGTGLIWNWENVGFLVEVYIAGVFDK